MAKIIDAMKDPKKLFQMVRSPRAIVGVAAVG